MSCLLNMHGLNNYFKITFFKSNCIINIFVPNIWNNFFAISRIFSAQVQIVSIKAGLNRTLSKDWKVKNSYLNNKIDNVSNNSQLKREQAIIA